MDFSKGQPRPDGANCFEIAAGSRHVRSRQPRYPPPLSAAVSPPWLKIRSKPRRQGRWPRRRLLRQDRRNDAMSFSSLSRDRPGVRAHQGRARRICAPQSRQGLAYCRRFRPVTRKETNPTPPRARRFRSRGIGQSWPIGRDVFLRLVASATRAAKAKSVEKQLTLVNRICWNFPTGRRSSLWSPLKKHHQCTMCNQ